MAWDEGQSTNYSYFNFWSQQILSSEIREAIFVNAFIISCALSVFGIAANLINMVVFWRMGFSTTSNISFFSLSISDLCSACLLIFLQFGNHPLFSSTVAMDLAIIANPAYYASCALGSWVTAVITVERCCCIVLPMKVKMIFTTRTVAGLIILMFVYQLATIAPHYYYMILAYSTPMSTNQTDSGSIYDNPLYDMSIGILSMLLSFSIPTTFCFIVVIIGTTFLVIGLDKSTQWRKSTVKQADDVAVKEKRVARIVIAVCVIYIVCFTPNVANIVIPSIYPEFNRFSPKFGNIVSVMFVFSVLFQAISGSVNIIIYLCMSAAYKDVFAKMLGLRAVTV